VMRCERPLPAPAHPTEARSALRRVTVLLVEDNRTNQLVVTMMLENEPVDLRVARNGGEAIALFPETAPDVVLMDVCMPGMDGFAATAAIRRIEAERGLPRTPVVALTAYAGQEHRARCLEHDMDDYLTKPLNKADLLAAIFARRAEAALRLPVPALCLAAEPCA
jgi:two-component system, sensor histidine kinase and response regulator